MGLESYGEVEYPGARSLCREPWSAATCASYPTLPAILAALAAAGHPYTVRGGAVFTAASVGQVRTLCQPPAPVITSIFPTPFAAGQPGIQCNGSLFDGAGTLTLGNAATWAGSTIKVTQTVTSWGVSQILFTSVQGGLPEAPSFVYAYVTTAGGQRNAVGFPCQFLPP